MRRLHPNLLRALLGVFLLASFWYWAAGTLDTWEMERHADRHVTSPLVYDGNTEVVTRVRPEARAAGIARGVRIIGLDGAAYTGLAQYHQILFAAHPGDTLAVEYARPDGTRGSGVVTLTRRAPPHGVAAWVTLAWDSIVIVLVPLVCLLAGYWVVLAKPLDRDAWLLLVLLTFPSVLWINPHASGGTGLAFRLYWFETLRVLAPPALLLFGAYFPERSRLDRRIPWIKWVILAPYPAFLAVLYADLHRLYFAAPVGPRMPRLMTDLGHGINALNLACIALYLVFTLDKLRSASTADARRRLRVLTAGTAIGVGALLLVFVLLPRLGLRFHSAHGFWIALAGGLVFMAAPLTLAYVVLVQRAMDVRVIVRMGARYAMAKAVLLAAQWVLVALAVWLLLLPAIHQRQPGTATFVAVLVFLALVVVLRVGLQKRAQRWLDRRFFREAYDAEVVLNELSDEVRKFTETAPLLETVARRVAETLHVERIAVLLRGSEVFHLAQAIGMPSNAALSLSAQAASVRYLTSTNGPARLYRDDPDTWYAGAGTSERKALDAVDAELLLPLRGRDRLVGLMALGPKRSEAAYSKADLHMLQTVATQTGLALEVTQLAHSLAKEAAQRERAGREMEIAREVQERLFPQRMPEIEGAAIAGHCRSALGVGGDYYDVFHLEDGRVGLAIGDVSGKGIAAALLMASLRASLRGVSLDTGHDFATLMEKVNRLVYEASAENRYATFFFGAYDPATRRLHSVNAGHNPPVVLRSGADGNPEVIRLAANGPVIGLLPSASYTEQSLELLPGDLLLLFTDGVSEAMDGKDEEWGEERMIASAARCRGATAEAVLQNLFHDVDAFAAGAPQHDDMTALILKLGP